MRLWVQAVVFAFLAGGVVLALQAGCRLVTNAMEGGARSPVGGPSKAFEELSGRPRVGSITLMRPWTRWWKALQSTRSFV